MSPVLFVLLVFLFLGLTLHLPCLGLWVAACALVMPRFQLSLPRHLCLSLEKIALTLLKIADFNGNERTSSSSNIVVEC